MLHEIKNVKQERGAGRRRWFESDGFEVVVWYGPANRVTGFQICYNFGHGEHALTWRPSGGFTHAIVDEGDSTPLKNETPILAPDGNVPWAEIAHEFDGRSETLDSDLRQLIHDKLSEKAGALH